MRIFVTGAAGFIGLAVVKELIEAGHRVIGLSRSETGAQALTASGAEVVLGTVEDPSCLAQGTAHADGIIHLAFNHDFSRFQQNCEDDRQVIGRLASLLAGSDRPLVVTSGTGIANTVPGRPARENDATVGSDVVPRAASEEAARIAANDGINVSIVRLPQVHDTRRQGLVSPAIEMYRAAGECVYVGDGTTRWPAAHRLDVARLYRLATERATPGARYHAVAEEGVPMRAIAESIARRLGLPVRSIAPNEAPAFFGWMARFVAHDMPADSALTRAVLGWQPAGPGLIADLDRLTPGNEDAAQPA